MKEIDFEKIKKEAKTSGVSEFLLLKRKMGYRLVNIPNTGRNCLNCKKSEKVSYIDGIIRHQCRIIGFKKDHHADIDDRHICRCYKFRMIEYK